MSILAFVASFFLLVPTARADVAMAARAFDEGNAHYAVGNYEAAITSYRDALGAGFVSSALFYNLGNANYRLDRLGEAVLGYERARRLAPDDPEIVHNLSIVQDRTEDAFSRLPTPYWQRGWETLVRQVGAWPFFVGGIVLWFVACGLFMYQILQRTRKPVLDRALYAGIPLAILFLVVAVAASARWGVRQQAVVMAQQVTLRDTPSNEADRLVDIHEGLVVDVLGEANDWRELRLPNGMRGWALTSAVELIDL